MISIFKVLRTFGYGAAGMGSLGGAVCIGKTNGSGEVILIGKPRAVKYAIPALTIRRIKE